MEQVTENPRPVRRRRRSPFQENRRLQGRLLKTLLLGMIAVVLILGFVIPDRAFSDSENRKLAQMPGMAELQSGTYLTALGEYVTDQFPFRDQWISLNQKLNSLIGQKESGGVYLCQDDYLMQIPAEPDWNQVQKNLDAVNRFADAHPELSMYMTVVPNAVTVMQDKLPKNAPVRDQEKDLLQLKNGLEKVRFVDVLPELRNHSSEYLYYKTDHHWTSLAAKYAFDAMAPALDIQPVTDYQVYPVSHTFEGTLASKSGSHQAKDTVEIFIPKTEIDYFVAYEDREVSSFYSREALDQKDHYTVFFGGNHPRVDITTTADTGRALLLFKDSYANCMVQFLYPYFDHIVMIDPRYYYDNLELAIRSEGITDVLYLYNLDTFLGDTSLSDVLTSEG